MSRMKIIDGHSHIASTRFVAGEFFEAVADNIEVRLRATGVDARRNAILDGIFASHQDHQGDAQVAAMDSAGIARSVLLLPDFTWALRRNPHTIEEMFEMHYLIMQRHPGRFDVFGGVDPRWGKDGLDLFIKGVECYGFAGLKLYPPCGYRADDALLTPFYEYCASRRLPVLMHIGPTSAALSFSEAAPIYVDAPARRHRDVAFILAHGAVNDQAQCIQLCKYRPNVYLDLSGAQHCVDRTGNAAELRPLFAADIDHKIIFGTDWPINNHASINRRLHQLIVGDKEANKPAAVSASGAQLIMSGNIQRLLAAKHALEPHAN
jgi:uncharacterized protein